MEDEFAHIRRWTRDWVNTLEGAEDVVIGIGDDAAVVTPRQGMQLVMTCDAMVENVHFATHTMDDRSIGWKAMASNVSDIVAMGGVPRWALVSLSIPQAWEAERIDAVYAGITAGARACAVRIVGGDTTSSPQHLVVQVTLIGEIKAGLAIPRSGARVGDKVFVTGRIGLSAAGLAVQCHPPSPLHKQVATAQQRITDAPLHDGGEEDEDEEADEMLSRPQEAHEADIRTLATVIRAHRRPKPRRHIGPVLAHTGLATALNDISDGLASEVWELAEASHVHVVLYEETLPPATTLQNVASWQGASALDWMLYGGEDYELVGTVQAARAVELCDTLQQYGATPMLIGEVVAGDVGVTWVDTQGKRTGLKKRGYNHFPTR